MPSIKDFEKKKKAQESQKTAENRKVKKQAKSISEDQDMETPKRRPSKEEVKTSVTEPETIVSEELNSKDTVEEMDNINPGNAAGIEEEKEIPQIHIEFPGSFILRSKFEKTFETLDKVATDWINDGDFEGLQVGHPLLQIAAAKSLKKAKEIEKKAQTTQAYALAKIGFEYAKSKLKK